MNVNFVDFDLSDFFFFGDEENVGIEEVKNEINGNWILVFFINEVRINVKVKRWLRKNLFWDFGRGDLVSDSGSDVFRSGLIVLISLKGRLLDRWFRFGKGRGLLKKGGVGGKGVWGIFG